MSKAFLHDAIGYSPFQQGTSALGEEIRNSQHLAGYQVDRRIDPAAYEVAILFSAHDRTYELVLRYPVGLDVSQPLLTIYATIVESFRLDRP